MEVNGLPIIKLGEILPKSFKNGIYKSSDSYGDGTPILRINDFDNNGNLVTTNLRKLELSPKEISSFQLQNGDIAVNRVNSLTHLGKSILWNGNDSNAVVYESNMMRIEPDKSVVLPEYLVRVLQSYNSRAHFRKVAKRAVAQCSINQQDVKSLKFPLPPLSEQKKIAQVLATWDQAISVTERLLSNSQQRKKALMQQFLTGKRRFLEACTALTPKKTRIGEIPGDWSYPKISDICSQITDKNTDDRQLPVLSCSKYVGFVDSLSYFKKKVYSDDLKGYRVIPRGCIGFPANHIEEGSIGLQNLYDYGLVSPIYVVARPDPKKVNADYLYAVLKTDHYRQIFCAATNASVDRRGSLRWKEFSQIHVPLPPLPEQNQMLKVLQVATQEISARQTSLECLKQEKNALMQQLLTGKRRVKVDAEAA